MSDKAGILIEAQDRTKDAFASLRANVREANTHLENLKGSVSSVTGVLGGLGVAVSAVGVASMIKNAIDTADNLNDLTKSTKLSIEQLAGLKLAAVQSGSDLESVAKGVNKLSVEMGKNAEKFAKIGVTAKDPIEALKQLSDIFSSIEDPQLRAAVAAEALGKQWEGLAPILAEGGESIGSMVEKGARLSKITQEAADQADKFNDQLAELKMTSDGFAMSLASDMLPGMNDAIGAIRTAYEESGKLRAVWVALGGLGAFLFTDEFASTKVKVQNLQKEIANLEDWKERTRSGFLQVWLFGPADDLDAKIAAAKAKILDLQKSMEKQPDQADPEIERKKAAAAAANAQRLRDFLDGQTKAKAAAEAYKKELEEQEKLLAKLAGINGDYMEQLTRLQVIRNKGRITEQEYVEAVKELIALQPKAKKQMEEMEKIGKDIAEARADLRRKEQDAIDEYFRSQTEGYNAAVKASNDALVAAQDEYAQFGMSKSQIAAITLLKLESAKASYLEGSEGYSAIEKQIAAQRELIGVLQKTEVQQAWKSIFDSIDQTAHDTFVSVFDSGKNAFDRLRDTLKNGLLDLLYQMTLKKWIFSIGASVSGVPGIANAGAMGPLDLIGNAAGAYNGLSSLGGMANAVGLSGAYNTVAGWFGATGMGLTGAGSIGGASSLASMGLAGGGMGAPVASTVATEAAGTSGILGSVGSAMPYLAAAVAIYSIAKSLDHSGTYHTGALAEYSASGGLLTGSNGTHAGPRAGDTNYGTGFGGVDFSQQTADFVGGISKSIVGILDSTASTFGKTAGYTAATAFADDTSKDGAWGALLISKLGEKVVDWQDTRNSSWAPREFGDGEAGRTQYLTELSKSVRTALDDIGLPGWAQSMLDNLGNAPALTDLAAVVDKINAVQKALVSMGNVFAGFSNLSDAAVSALVTASGGVDQFVAGMSGFYDGYFSEAEKIANVSGRVSDALSAVGLAMPTTREEFRSLVEQELALGEAGAPAVAALLSVSGAFGTVADYSKQMADQSIADAQRQADETARIQQEALAASQRIADQRADLELRIMELSGDAAGALAIQRQRELAAMDEALRPLQQRIYALQDIATAEQNALTTFQDFMSGINSTLDSSRSALQSSWDDLKRRAGAGDAARQLLQQAYDRESAENARRIATADTARQALQQAYDRESADNARRIAAADTARQALDAAVKSQSDAFQNTIDQFDAFTKSLADFRNQLASGDLSTLSPEQKYLRSKAEFERISAAAGSGDVEAIGRLQESASAFLTASRGFNASSGAYASDFASADAALQAVQAFTQSKADDGRAQLESLNQQVAGVLTASNNSALSVAEAVANLQSVLPDAQAARLQQTTLDQQVAGLLTVNASVTSVEDAITNLQAALSDADAARLQQTTLDQQVAGLLTVNASVTSVEDAIANLQAVLPDAQAAQQELNLRQQEVNALLGLNTGVMSLQSAIDAFRTVQNAVTAANSNQSAISGMYRDILGHEADSAGLASWMNVLNSGGTLDQVRAGIQNSPENMVQDLYTSILGRSGTADEIHTWQMRALAGTSMDDIRAAFLNSDEYLHGSHANGLDYVPFDGYRAELHRGERVQTASQVKESDTNNREMVSLLREVLMQIRAGNGISQGQNDRLDRVAQRLSSIENESRLAGAR
ncbi:DUF4214 domain-containing protein [Noviherbaspirillum sp. ST 5-3]|uniref:DUF4214 domain-containing protein n=1 Tax=Noviherbaspirillum sp. ST 5-3 TaxID=3349878 RepID=UPI003916E33A